MACGYYIKGDISCLVHTCAIDVQTAERCHAETNMHWCFVFHTAVCRDLEATNAILDQTIRQGQNVFCKQTDNLSIKLFAESV